MVHVVVVLDAASPLGQSFEWRLIFMAIKLTSIVVAIRRKHHGSRHNLKLENHLADNTFYIHLDHDPLGGMLMHVH